MRHKDKIKLMHVGARIRVATATGTGAERWKDAPEGTIAALGKKGAEILIDGDREVVWKPWADLDLASGRPRDHLIEIPLSEVIPSRWQYRKQFDEMALLELAQSIWEYNLINPILVFKAEGDKFELIAGERRIRAIAAIAINQFTGETLAKAVGIMAARDIEWWTDAARSMFPILADTLIRAELRPGEPGQYREIAVIENLQRENPSPIEEAGAFEALMLQRGWTQRDLARHLSKSDAYISQRLGLLDLADEVKEVAHAGKISFSNARAIASVPLAIQPALIEQIQTRLGTEDPATARQVQTMAAQIRRFFDPGKWQPDPDQIIRPAVRNRLRLLQYHIAWLMDHDPERAGELSKTLRNLQGTNYLGKMPLTIAHQDYMSAMVLGALTDSGQSPYSGVDLYWESLAILKGYTCKTCQVHAAPAPAEVGVQKVVCNRWAGGKNVTTCLNWIGDGDPVMLTLDWKHDRILEDYAGQLEGIEPHDLSEHDAADHRFYLEDIAQYAALVEFTAEKIAKEAAANDRRVRLGHLDDMIAYYEWQPVGLDPKALFTLVHPQCHACRDCLHFRPELEKDPDVGMPCQFAAVPLPARWGVGVRAPEYTVIVSEGGMMCLRCEKYQAAEIQPGMIKPIQGIGFGGQGRPYVLEWLEGVSKRGMGWSTRYGALGAGPLSWLPYARPAEEKSHDLGKVIAWIRDHWSECGDDPGVARLISVAMHEARAGRRHDGIMGLMNVANGELERWAVIRWETFINGERPNMYGYPKGWPMPWLQEGNGEPTSDD